MKLLIFDADAKTRQIFSAAFPEHELVFFEHSPKSDDLTAHPDAEIVSIFTASTFKEDSVDALPHLRCIATRSTGFDHIAVEYAKHKGITVCNVPRYGTHTVAEFTFALILALSRKVPEAVQQVRDKGSMTTAPFEGINLFGKTLGVIGTGAIGKSVVRIAQGFGMSILMHDPFPAHEIENEHTKYVAFDDLIRQSDIITLHVPYTKENKHIIGKDQFTQMKHGVYLINTARGELVDTQALCDALEYGTVAGAGLDVLEAERELKDEQSTVTNAPPEVLQTLIRDRELIDNPRVLVTPHIAFFSREAYEEILTVSVKNIQNAIAGTPSNTL